MQITLHNNEYTPSWVHSEGGCINAQCNKLVTDTASDTSPHIFAQKSYPYWHSQHARTNGGQLSAYQLGVMLIVPHVDCAPS